MTESGKTVLMVSYYYPPLAGIGMLRTVKFARYLPEHGWHPLVLTPACGSHPYTCNASEGDLPGVDVIRTGYFDVPTLLKNIIGFKPGLPVSQQAAMFGKKPPLPDIARRALRLSKSLILFPDSRIGWYRSAVREGLEAIRKYQPDVIYSTSPPVTAHLVARRLKRLTGVPWVAELRDLWSENHQTTEWPRWREMLETFMEKKTLSDADGIITVSNTFARRLASKLDSFNGKQVVIPNGFDPGDYKKVSVATQDRFTISHTGDLYGMSRDPAPLFAALKNLIAEGSIDPADLELNFYGLRPGSHCQAELKRLAADAGLEAQTNARGAVAYRDSLALQQRSTLLLAVEILTERGKWVVPGKLFEHLGAGRPSLALVPHGGEVQKLLADTNGGMAFDPRHETGALEDALRSWYQEWRRTGTVTFRGRPEVIHSLTRQAGAERLAGFMEHILNGKRSEPRHLFDVSLEKRCQAS